MLRRLLLPVAAAGTAALTAGLGLWQLDRAAQKDALHASIQARAQEPALSAGQLQGLDQVHRLVQLQGQWLAHSTVFLENRPMGGRAGFFVLTALQLPDGLAAEGADPLDAADGYLCELKEAQIRTGLHRFGQLPEAGALAELLACLARPPQAEGPGLTQALARDHGLELDPWADPEEQLLSPADQQRLQRPVPPFAVPHGRVAVAVVLF